MSAKRSTTRWQPCAAAPDAYDEQRLVIWSEGMIYSVSLPGGFRWKRVQHDQDVFAVERRSA